MARLLESTRQARLDALAELLTTPRTARELAAALSVTLPTVYARLEQLQNEGRPLTLGQRREGARGPEAVTFSLR